MRIVVCVKQIPNPEGEPRFEAGHIVRGEDDMLSELDDNAVEAALQIAETHGGSVSALTMGPASSEIAARRALQLGADAAYHVCDDALAGSDALGTATVLAAAVERLSADEPIDLVLCGMGSLDARTSLLPGALATLLGYSQLTMARSVEVRANEIHIERAIDGVVERLAGPLPAVVSVTDEANTPRFPNVKNMMAARKKPVTVWSCADLGLDSATVGQAGAGSRVLAADPATPKAGPRMYQPDDDGIGQLADYLIDNRLVTKVQA